MSDDSIPGTEQIFQYNLSLGQWHDFCPGVVQAAKNAWLKSGVNLVRSLRYIKDFEEGADVGSPWCAYSENGQLRNEHDD